MLRDTGILQNRDINVRPVLRSSRVPDSSMTLLTDAHLRVAAPHSEQTMLYSYIPQFPMKFCFVSLNISIPYCNLQWFMRKIKIYSMTLISLFWRIPRSLNLKDDFLLFLMNQRAVVAVIVW
jgi:hypothetical protein